MDIEKEMIKSKLINKIDSDETIESVVNFDSEYIKTGIECIFRSVINMFVGSKSEDLDIAVTYFSPMMYMDNKSYNIYSEFLLNEIGYSSSHCASDKGSIDVMEKIINYINTKAQLSDTQILYSRRALRIRFDFYYGSSDLDRLFRNFNEWYRL